MLILYPIFIKINKGKFSPVSVYKNLNNKSNSFLLESVEGNKEFAEVIAKFNTDWVWAEPARFAANAFVKVGEPTYLFHFDFVDQIQTMAFLKNLGLAGGFLFIVANGTKEWAIEREKKYVRL